MWTISLWLYHCFHHFCRNCLQHVNVIAHQHRISDVGSHSNNSYNFIDISIKISHSTQKKREIQWKFVWQGVCKSQWLQKGKDAFDWYVYYMIRRHILFFSVIYDFSILFKSVSVVDCMQSNNEACQKCCIGFCQTSMGEGKCVFSCFSFEIHNWIQGVWRGAFMFW